MGSFAVSRIAPIMRKHGRMGLLCREVAHHLQTGKHSDARLHFRLRLVKRLQQLWRGVQKGERLNESQQSYIEAYSS